MPMNGVEISTDGKMQGLLQVMNGIIWQTKGILARSIADRNCCFFVVLTLIKIAISLIYLIFSVKIAAQILRNH